MCGECRPEVEAFAGLMERVLKENDFKGGWKDLDPAWLVLKLEEEVAEIRDMVLYGFGSNEQMMEAMAEETADVANIAMMIADVCGCLQANKE